MYLPVQLLLVSRKGREGWPPPMIKGIIIRQRVHFSLRCVHRRNCNIYIYIYINTSGGGGCRNSDDSAKGALLRKINCYSYLKQTKNSGRVGGGGGAVAPMMIEILMLWQRVRFSVRCMYRCNCYSCLYTFANLLNKKNSWGGLGRGVPPP